MSRPYQQTISSEKIREIAERALKFRTLFEALNEFLERSDKADVMILDYEDIAALALAIEIALMSCARGAPNIQEIFGNERM